MRYIIGTSITITLAVIVKLTWKPTLKWVLTRIPPETPPNWAPKYRTWKNGIEQ